MDYVEVLEARSQLLDFKLELEEMFAENFQDYGDLASFDDDRVLFLKQLLVAVNSGLAGTVEITGPFHLYVSYSSSTIFPSLSSPLRRRQQDWLRQRLAMKQSLLPREALTGGRVHDFGGVTVLKHRPKVHFITMATNASNSFLQTLQATAVIASIHLHVWAIDPMIKRL